MKVIIALVAVVCVLGIAASRAATVSHPLADPATFSSVQAALRHDLTKLRHDLRTEDSDARSKKDEPHCYLLANNVNFDVLKTVDSFVTGTVVADQANMQADVFTIRNDRIDFRKDVNDFVNDGVRGPSGAAATLADIARVTWHWVTTADAIIKQIDHEIALSYAVADRLAVGPCSADKPENQTRPPNVPLVH